ncbi:hypothetical protein WALSEDRAFT_60407 [Wallemia mellicola CBS 633.66]|uniref:GOLD domain-containing protein n=2 Tax=Wallemia mellicola TaxID=1708541 RepID=I4YBQ7_WALMC|nr:hypothetical protein WALSEDRAFT_60407 [Wallemia mellicola CBS 633.66]EIM21399.1 hypothetical protein WALSEDRAFT_60407 [Wallemia mellicola CBS 633.66]|eukprot:XP_006958432.1 hypothetical protein WALSEDRAFT_60407 [Wallemia mellicola CBS 633.66]
MKQFNVLLILLILIEFTQCLHFYMESNDRRCFLEEVPADTLVSGKYKAEEYDQDKREWVTANSLGVLIQVEETEEKHPVVNSKGPSIGSFTFTSHLAGDHTVCLSTNSSNVSWYKGKPTLRIHLDIAIGAVKHDESADLNHLQTLTNRVRDLNAKLNDVRKEQEFQREREVEFRDISDSTNKRTITWSIIQMIVVAAACYWQSSHLRNFFNEKKLR